MKPTIEVARKIDDSRLYAYAMFATAALFLYLTMATTAYATNSILGTSLCLIVQWMYGNIGRSIATLAVMVLGVGASLGKVTWGLAMTVAIGISVIFNAGSLVTLLVPAFPLGGIVYNGCPVVTPP